MRYKKELLYEEDTEYPELHYRAWLKHKYINEQCTLEDIASIIGCDPSAVFRAIERFDLPFDYHLRHRKLNLLEQKVDEKLQKLYPNEWKFNGCGECGVVLGSLIPDFINVNGTKAVIEVFGDVYHDPEKAFHKVPWKSQEFGRKAVFSQLGYKCVILKECDLNEDLEKTIIDNIEPLRSTM